MLCSNGQSICCALLLFFPWLSSGSLELLKHILKPDNIRNSDLVFYCYPAFNFSSEVISFIRSTALFFEIALQINNSQHNNAVPVTRKESIQKVFVLDYLHLNLSTLLAIPENAKLPQSQWRPRTFVLLNHQQFSELLNSSSLRDHSTPNYDFLRYDTSFMLLSEEPKGDLEVDSQSLMLNAAKWRATELFSYKNKLYANNIINKISSHGQLSSEKLYDFFATHISKRTLTGILLNVVARAQPNVVSTEVQFSDGEPLQFKGGYAVDILWDLRDLLNFSIQPVTAIDEHITLEGKWARAIFHKISSGEADFSISQLPSVQAFPTLRDSNQQMFQWPAWLHPTYHETSLTIIFKQPATNSIRNVYLMPFQLALWFSYFTLLGTVALSFALISVCKAKVSVGSMTESSHKRYQLSPVISDPNCKPNPCEKLDLFWVIGSACQQGYWTTVPKWTYLKLPMLLGSAIGMVFYIAYATAIISILSTPVVPVRSVEDLIKNGFTFITHEKSESGKSWLQSLIDSKHLRQTVVVTDTASEVKVLEEGLNALVSYWRFFYRVAALKENIPNSIICESFTAMPTDTQTQSMFLTNGSPFKEHFNVKILVLKERGFLSRYYTAEMRPSTLACSRQVSYISVAIYDAMPSFFILFGGLGCSIVILISEFIFIYVQHLYLFQISLSHS